LFAGVIFGLGLMAGLDAATTSNGLGANALSPVKTSQTLDVGANAKFVSAAMH